MCRQYVNVSRTYNKQYLNVWGMHLVEKRKQFMIIQILWSLVIVLWERLYYLCSLIGRYAHSLSRPNHTTVASRQGQNYKWILVFCRPTWHHHRRRSNCLQQQQQRQPRWVKLKRTVGHASTATTTRALHG